MWVEGARHGGLCCAVVERLRVLGGEGDDGASNVDEAVLRDAQVRQADELAVVQGPRLQPAEGEHVLVVGTVNDDRVDTERPRSALLALEVRAEVAVEGVCRTRRRSVGG